MDTEWKACWDHFISDPMPLGTVLVSLVVGIWLAAWALRAYIGKERVAVLEERVRFGEDLQKFIKSELEKLQSEVSQAAPVIYDLINVQGARPHFEKLSRTSATLSSLLPMIARATDSLGTTLASGRDQTRAKGTCRFLRL